MGGFRKYRRGGPDNYLFVFLDSNVFVNVFPWVRSDPLENHLDPLGPIVSRGWSVPELPRKPIATCYFPGDVRTPCTPPSPLWIRPLFTRKCHMF